MPARLARRYDEPVEVERRDDAPARFVRRDRTDRRRVYEVRTVLAHWWETGPWWEAADSGAGDDERELWRIEAAPVGRAASAVVVELCLSWSTGAWTLTGVLD